LKTNFEIQYFFNTFNTAWEPCFDDIAVQCLIKQSTPTVYSLRHTLDTQYFTTSRWRQLSPPGVTPGHHRSRLIAVFAEVHMCKVGGMHTANFVIM